MRGSPLSPAQQRLWFLEQLDPGGWSYNLPEVLRLDGLPRIPVVAAALREIVRRHGSLRSRFPSVEGRPLQVVDPHVRTRLAVVDLTTLGRRRQRREARRLAMEHARQPFDLAGGPLLRTTLLRLDGEPHVLLLCAHHMVCDGWSQEILRHELLVLYDAFAAGRPSPLPELALQAADAADLRRRPPEAWDRLLAWWRQQLHDAPRQLLLPTPRQRPPLQSHRGDQLPRWLSAALTGALHNLGRSQNASLFMTLLAALGAFLHRVSGEHDLIVGTPVAARRQVELEGLIGMFVDTLPLRLQLPRPTDRVTFRDLLKYSRDQALAAYAHQEIAFEDVIREVRPDRELSHAPLFQVFLNVRSFPQQAAQSRLRPLDWSPVAAKFDLSLEAEERQDRLRLNLIYSTDLFDRTWAGRALSSLATLLAGAVADPETALGELPLLSTPQRHQLLVEWANPEPPVGGESTPYRQFQRQAASSPDTVALVYGDHHLTYGELDRRASELSHRLAGLGAGAESLVAVCLRPSSELVIGILAILRAGAAWVPLDPELPTLRHAELLADTAPRLLLTHQRSTDRLPVTTARVLELDTPAPVATTATPCRRSAKSLAFVVYTSGSTGRPKGVQIVGGGLTTYLRWLVDLYALSAGDTVPQLAPCGFDMALRELAPLYAGARLVLVDRTTVRDPQLLLETLARHRVTSLLGLVPALLDTLVEQAARTGPLSHLRLLAIGGDRLPGDLAVRADRQLAPGARIINQYGPTEITGTASAHSVTDNDAGADTLPLGRPHPHRSVYVLDRRLRPVSIGVTGEIVLGGAGIARGYLGRQALTAAVFVPDPFTRRPGGRLYLSGDLGRTRVDGILEFLGRRDLQVKIRGVRVESGEVEAVLRQHPAVGQTAVRVWGDGPREQRLVAYLTSVGDAPPGPEELRDFVGQRLPAAMVPAVFITLEAMPRNPRGKLDRAALPPPDGTRPRLAATALPPRTETERLVAEVWRQVLRLDQVGADDNFFDLGGHSLLLTQVRSKLRQRLGGQLTILDLFRHPTVSTLARHLQRDAPKAAIAVTAAPGHGRLERRAAVSRQRRARRRHAGRRGSP